MPLYFARCAAADNIVTSRRAATASHSQATAKDYITVGYTEAAENSSQQVISRYFFFGYFSYFF
jgi:hypothetical protein